MFERHQQKKAQEHYEEQLAEWKKQHDETAQLIELAHGNVETNSDQILLKPGEHLIGSVTGAGLIEERRGAGHWQGGSQGISIPIGSIGGRSVRYRVGETRGHFVQGAPVATAVDTGTLFITDQRLIFEGARQTRECAFAKLIGVQYSSDGAVSVSVSNRQKPTTVHYGPNIAGWVHFRIELALARFRGTTNELIEQLNQQLSAIDRLRPVPPPPIT